MRKVVKLSGLSHEEAHLAPRRARQVLTEPVPKYELPANGMDADVAYQLIHDELLLDGSARLNLATFVTTWMEPQAPTDAVPCNRRMCHALTSPTCLPDRPPAM